MSGHGKWYSSGREEYVPPGFPRQLSSPIEIPSSTAQRRASQSSPSASTASGSYSEGRGSLASTSLSTAPSMTLHDYGYEYLCEFAFLGCGLTFHPTQTDSYISHTASHFLSRRPPPKTICIFCNRIFENARDREGSWEQRIRHMADHFRNGALERDTRPDFHTIEYMGRKGILSREDYKSAKAFTERPVCDGLVDSEYRPLEMVWKAERRTAERHDQDKEDRYRKREKDKQKASKNPKKTEKSQRHK